MHERLNRFFIAFFATLILCALGAGIVAGIIYLTLTCGPLVAFSLTGVAIAIFAGLMHASEARHGN